MENPYSATTANPTHQSKNEVTPAMIQSMQATKPWVRFCSILGFICTGLIFLGSLSVIAFGSIISGTATTTGLNMPSGVTYGLFAAVYVVIGLLYLFPSVKLWKYGNRIVDLIERQSTHDLEAALDAQRSFWKLVGIMLAVFIGLYLVFIVIAVIVGLFAGVSA